MAVRGIASPTGQAETGFVSSWIVRASQLFASEVGTSLPILTMLTVNMP
jgi:hypothetical protein